MPLSFVWIQDGNATGLADAREMFEEYQRELGVDLSFQGFQDELAKLPGKYGSPGGALLLVYDDRVPAACGAIKDLGDGFAELKRLYVRPQFRGIGLGKQITETLMDRALAFGYLKLRLDTLRRLEPALALYSSLGFAETAPYNENPEDDIVYLERTL
jgi:GNAT superfamily N-acetyltransferase